jgi:hypothetical protein
LLAVNMQTSFMHPPFGFALFYLRSVAPLTDYTDKITHRKISKVSTEHIYWGAVPFVIIQIMMVGLMIFNPGLVMRDTDKKMPVNLDQLQKQVDQEKKDTGNESKEDPMEALRRLNSSGGQK